MSRSTLVLGLVFGVLVITPAAPAKTKIVSHWLDREIVIDGELDEWRDALVYVKSVDAFVAMFNDSESLYLCLYSQAPAVAEQFAADGVRTRIDHGKDGKFVVLSPAGGEVLELSVSGQRDVITVAASGEAGIAAGMSRRGSFVYELRVPLAADGAPPWAPDLRPGDHFKLTLVNPQIDKLAEDRAARENRHTGSSPFDPGQAGRTAPGWTAGDRGDETYFENPFVFLLKARVELAQAP